MATVGPITFTLDLEETAPAGSASRIEAVMETLLEALAAARVCGTVFIVGELGEAHPELVRAVAAAGHEVALHGWEHAPLAAVGPERLAEQITRGRDVLEQAAQAPVVGFRAPMFSLVPAVHWALDLIGDAGFRYSSSVLPARSPLWGDPGAPRHPFRWPNGLLELPCPVATFGGVANPYLGGVYFRVLPWPMVRYGLSQSAADEVLWLYCHPYDFDPGEPFRPRAELGRYSRLMYLGRTRMLRRVERVLAGRTGAPLATRAETIT